MKSGKSVYKSLALITQLGISMLVPIFLCTFLGVFLEDRFSISVFVPLLIIGMLAGGRNVYMLVKHVNKDVEVDTDDKE
ncbi:MAG: AtpZ/AtpI family protein [Lachnotalea sp.]